MSKIRISLLLVCLASLCVAQDTFPKNDVTDKRADRMAFTGVTLHLDHETKVENAILVIEKDKVIAAGANVTVPADAVVLDLAGKHVYPSFIDPYASYGMPKVKKSSGSSWGRKETIEPETKGAYNSNDAIKSQQRAAAMFETNSKKAAEWRKAGYGTVLSFYADGIARGTGTLVTLGDDRENKVMLRADASAHYSFSKGSSKQNYPSSTMGVIALLRQTELDAQWYNAHEQKPFSDQSLDAWLATAELPQIFEARNWKDILRVAHVGEEMGKSFVIKSDGDAYQRTEEIKATGRSLIVPLDFPEAPKVNDALESYRPSLKAMKHWELAPSNAGMLAKAGIPFAFTSKGLKKKSKMMGNLRKAMKRGLSEQDALRALTSTPAAMLGVDKMLGSLKPGYLANFLVTDGPVFGKESRILENWVAGKRYAVTNAQETSLAGTYKLTFGDRTEQLTITGKPGKYKASLKASAKGKKKKKKSKDDKDSGGKLSITVNESMVTLISKKDHVRLSGWRTAEGIEGRAVLKDGSISTFKAVRTGDGEKKEKKKKVKKESPALSAVTRPFLPFGWTEKPEAETLLIRNATVWTMEADGVLKETDVLVKDGKIAQIGKNLPDSGARVIDGTGKHLTPGIIDEHSHIALDSVNDTTTNSGMVRMGDVVDSEDINIFRNLAGGVVAAQLLHGSANPIGGQSALIKMRWGAAPRDMLIEDADGFIKFALGENVKRSSNSNSIRYPKSRMGVEQVYMDAFSAAADYREAHNAYNALADKTGAVAPRRDLALDAMVEIMEKERFITCHSYVQSEINMLMHVAEKFGFNVNTFTHILEGYKVAEKMADHGVGGSTFSDWWAYKWEVRYAIPYNTTLMHDAGVTVAVNSDSSEMSRRLNQEAAKSVKYGGMSEEDALKMVTINPAKLLHLDDRMGSVKAGKDADLVLWSDNPLSIYARAEKTMVDGVLYFELDKHEAQLEAAEAERTRLVNKIMKAGGGSASGGKWGGQKPELHCDTDGDLILEGGAL